MSDASSWSGRAPHLWADPLGGTMDPLKEVAAVIGVMDVVSAKIALHANLVTRPRTRGLVVSAQRSPDHRPMSI